MVEHFWDGMGGILSEARRVLEDAGVLLLSVPDFSPLFRRRAAKRCWTQRNTGCCGPPFPAAGSRPAGSLDLWCGRRSRGKRSVRTDVNA